MVKSILAVDSLAIQRSLTLLEDRYRELREIGQKRFEGWEAEISELKQQLAEQSAQAAEAKQACDQQAERVKALEAETVEAAQATEELKHQLSEQAKQLREEQQGREEKAERVKALEAEKVEAGQAAEELKLQLAEEAAAKAEALEEAELILLQLHQVQEELEHYFLHAQSSQQLAHAQQEQLGRVQALMARLLPEAAVVARDPRVDVEVLPPLPPAAPVQTEALLSSYASSLHRAGLLLQRALQR